MMPTLAQEQIDEIEHEMADLVDENKELRQANTALLAELARIKATGEVV